MTPLAWLAIPVLATLIAAIVAMVMGPLQRRHGRERGRPGKAEVLRRELAGDPARRARRMTR